MPDETPTTQPTTGVSMTPPPAQIMGTISGQIDAAINAMPKDTNGMLVMNVETTAGVNLAFVKKFDHDWSVMAWVGKKWGAPVNAGVSVRKTFD